MSFDDIQKQLDDMISQAHSQAGLNMNDDKGGDRATEDEEVFLEEEEIKNEQDTGIEKSKAGNVIRAGKDKEGEEEEEEGEDEAGKKFVSESKEGERSRSENEEGEKRGAGEGEWSVGLETEKEEGEEKEEAGEKDETRAFAKAEIEGEDLEDSRGSEADRKDWGTINRSGLKISSSTKTQELKDKMREMEIKKKEEERLGQARAKGFGYINLKGLPIVPEALRLIDENEAREKRIICFMYRKGVEIRLAAEEEGEGAGEVVNRLKEEHEGINIAFYLTSRVSMDEALKLYNTLPKIIKETDEVAVLEADVERLDQELTNMEDLQEKFKGVSTTEVFSLVLAAAVKMETSDIHIEAEEGGIQVRFRIDGVLHDMAVINKEVWKKLISRIKLNAGLKINVQDKPQDGRFSAKIKGKPLDFRVSTIPTAYGESVVMRILYQDKIKEMTLENLGISEHNNKIIMEEIERPNGMVVVTGPTGSGKTTTLYAILNRLNTPDNKIITVEDPIEYKLEGINQSEINEGRGYNFASALRSIVRQDPDIILVGEIRDKETAEISLNAALTGHLVFSTIHTNDAAGAIPRFLSLGAKSYLLAPAINVILAQRLVRRICNNCKEKRQINEAEKSKLAEEAASLPEKFKQQHNIGANDIANLVVYKGRGCDKCAGLGYKGQIGIFEIFRVTEEVKDQILSKEVSDQTLRRIAVKEGMITMAQDGILKALEGVTTLEEVLRVT